MKIAIKNLQKKIPILPLTSQGIKKAILKTLSLKGTKLSGEITICLVNDKRIQQLNLRYRHKNNPTDVIVFDLSNKKSKDILADIVISTDTAWRNARIFKTNILYELYLYLVHGILHLLGYDDKTPRQRKIMDKRANQILTTLNFKR